MALTDHDTTAGLQEAVAAGQEFGIEVIPGIELACHTTQSNVHILGYFFDAGDVDLESFLNGQRCLRHYRNLTLAGQLQDLGMDISFEEVAEYADGAVMGRPHFAAKMVEKGYANSVNDAFDRYLGANRPAYIERRELSVRDAIAAIHGAGGVAVWAHPLRRDNPNYDVVQRDLEEMTAAGLDGLEAWYSRFSEIQRKELAAIAEKHSVVASGGSDYHGMYKPDLSVGSGLGDLAVPYSVIDDLRTRIQ